MSKTIARSEIVAIVIVMTTTIKMRRSLVLTLQVLVEDELRREPVAGGPSHERCREIADLLRGLSPGWTQLDDELTITL